MNTLKLLTVVKIYINTYICQALARYSSRSYCKSTGRVLLTLLYLVFQCLYFSFKALKNTSMLLTCIAVFHMFSLSAQTPRKDSGADGLPPVNALNIGDKISQSLWDMPLQVVNHPSGKKTIKLSEYRDKKLIILDFWAIWCASCIESLGKIQNKLNYDRSKIAFVPVTFHPDSMVTKFKQSNRGANGWQFPLVVNDNLLKQLFQHSSISHFVWISNDGVIKAFTSSEYITESQLANGLKDDFTDVKMKIDQIDFDPAQPFMVQHSRAQYTGFRRFLAGVAPISGIQSSDSTGLKRRYFVNTSLRSLCLDAMTNREIQLSKKKIVYDVKDQEIYFNKKHINADVWNQKYGLCYEAILPDGNTVSSFRTTLREDLNRHFNIQLAIEERPIRILALSMNGVKSSLTVDESIDLKTLVDHLNNRDNAIPFLICPPQLESIRVSQRLKECTTANELAEIMAEYGIRGVERKENHKVLVIRERSGS